MVSQSSFFSNVIDKSLSKVIPLWSTAQRRLPKNIFNFSIRSISNCLPNRINLTKWGMSPTSDCSFCIRPESLLYIVASCKKYLKEGRYTWRHDSILYFLANSFQSIENFSLYVLFPGFISLCALTGDSLRPDLVSVIPDKCLYIPELTDGFERNLRNNSHRKQLKYMVLIREQQKNFNEVRSIYLSMSALGVFDLLSKGFIDTLQDLNFDEATTNYVIRWTMTIAIRTTYYIFCHPHKDWDFPELLKL